MSIFTTIASLQCLTDRELDILLRTVLERLAGCRAGRLPSAPVGGGAPKVALRLLNCA